MFTVDEIIQTQYPGLSGKSILLNRFRLFMRWLLKEDMFIDFARSYPHLRGIEFVEQALEYFDFSCMFSDRELENIPDSGKVIIIANHPIGSLDGLSLLKLIYGIRPDVKIVANELLFNLKPLRELLLPVKNTGGRTPKWQIVNIMKALEQEQAVIFFPAGEVSRVHVSGIRDCGWNPGFLKIATRTKAPVVPVHIRGRNSLLFYSVSMLCKPLSTAMLIREMFGQKSKRIRFRIGKIVPYSSYAGLSISHGAKAKLFRKHLYHLGKDSDSVFRTNSPVARPEKRYELKRELNKADLIGETGDGKKIYLYDFIKSSPVMREIGRLREIAFRAVEEGTGDRRDLDKYDQYYRHIILWDAEVLEIVGAYRFADASMVVEKNGIQGLYSGKLFEMNQQGCWFLKNGIELGRSFIQPRYWGRRGLDYLWSGIGSFLSKNPHYRYLFGPVSISSSMPVLARELLICFYKMYFGFDNNNIAPRNPLIFTNSMADLEKEFSGTDYRADFRRLKMLLGNMGVSIPPLYKQYSELCRPGGVRFLDFNIDPEFNNCVDGLVIVDLEYLKDKKRERYMKRPSVRKCA